MFNIINGFASEKNLNILKQPSEMVESTLEAHNIINILLNNLNNINNAVGLAAIQLGFNKKVAVIKTFKPNNNFLFLINPEIVEQEEKFIYYNESCLSFPNKYYNTERYKHLIIKNYVIKDKNKFREEQLYFYTQGNIKDNYENIFCPYDDSLISIAVQHEIDHLEGKIIPEYAVKNITYKNITQKIGRNELCPCGSGKKYKKCCGMRL